MCVLDEIGFTPEQYFELKDKRMTDEEIAYDELDITPWHLAQWKKRHGVRNGKIRHGKKFTREEWEEKRKEGLTEPAIAEFFEYKTFSIYLRYKRSIGIPSMTKKIERTPELLAEIKKYLDQGLLIKEITEKISVKMSSAMVGRIIREEGLHDGKSNNQKRFQKNRKTARQLYKKSMKSKGEKKNDIRHDHKCNLQEWYQKRI